MHILGQAHFHVFRKRDFAPGGKTNCGQSYQEDGGTSNGYNAIFCNSILYCIVYRLTIHGTDCHAHFLILFRAGNFFQRNTGHAALLGLF